MEKKEDQKATLGEAEKYPFRRPPVVVVLGHIDHGKTTLLDAIRKTSLVAKEKGGITQHIGAYQIESGGRKITFIDTPGHEAFSAMRARGARVADVAVLVVDASEGVKPQTREAVAHAQTANVPIIVAINKIDLPSSDPKKVKEQLSKEGLVPEEWGGQTVFVEVSAKQGRGIPNLLEMITLVSDFLSLSGDPSHPFSGVVIEASSTKAGPQVTVLVNEGVLKVGDKIFSSGDFGKVRSMRNVGGGIVPQAHPGDPVSVLGFSQLPKVGEVVWVGKAPAPPVSFEPRNKVVFKGKLNLILKADTRGTLEAVEAGVQKISPDIKILYSGVGEVNDSDVLLAKNTGALILGFNTVVARTAKLLAEDSGVGVRTFSIIYELLEAAEKIFTGVEELEREKAHGEALVSKLFRLHSKDVVCGVRVLAGKIKFRDRVRVVREEELVGEGWVRGLRKQEKNVREAGQDEEAGILIKPQFDFAEGDKIYVI